MEKAQPQIILIAYHFPPAQEIGGFRPFRFYKYLKRMGYVCHVITASPQEQTSPDNIVFLPDRLQAFWDAATNERLPFEAALELSLRKAMFLARPD